MSFPRVPWLQQRIVGIVGELRSMAQDACLVDLAYPGETSSVAVTRAMGQLARVGGVQVDVTSHCGRVGTCTALMQLGMPLELVNSHVGWGHRSEAAVRIYNRPGT